MLLFDEKNAMQYKLTDTKIRQAKSKDKDYPLADGGGLRLIVRANGSKVFVFNYNRPYTKKKNNITLGAYPEISLKQARERHAQARALLAQDIDPVQQREQDKREQVNKLDRTFGKMAVNWFEQRKQQADFSERTAKDTWALFERHILPNFAQYPITEITPLIAINALKPLEKDGKLETVRKVIGKLNDVMKFALHRGFISTNNLSDIHKEFDKPVTQGMKTISPEEIEEFLTALYQEKNNQRFQLNAFYAVMLVMFTGGRPSEIAKAKWSDINFDERVWVYSVQKGNRNLPQGRVHKVTLSSQVIKLFEKVREYNQLVQPNLNSDYVFASSLSRKKGHISIETIRNAIIKSLGENRLTTHGIRHLFSTALNEQEYNADWIERALSHKDKNTIRGFYNKAEYLEHRFKMLQAWADYLENKAPEKLFS